MIEKTQEKYHEAEDVRVFHKGQQEEQGQGHNVDNKAEEDEEMQDVDNEDEHTMPSFNDMNVELAAAGNVLPPSRRRKGRNFLSSSRACWRKEGGRHEEKNFFSSKFSTSLSE